MRLALPVLLLACHAETPKPAVKADPICDLADIDLPKTYALSAPVEVRVDDRGIPHVYAQNDTDLFYGAGYTYAKERLFQLDTWRRQAHGTMAEVHGEDYVDDDLGSRTFAFDRWACESVALVAEQRPEDFALLVAYISGVNTRVAEVNASQAELPFGFGPDELDYAPAPFEVSDIVAIGRRINFGYSDTLSYDLLYTMLQKLVPQYDAWPIFRPGPERYIVADTAPEGPAARPSAAHAAPEPADIAAIARLAEAAQTLHGTFDLGGSNSWAVNGAHTENGRPLVANDPHAGWYDPSLLMPLHLDSAGQGGTFSVIGFAFPGVPGVQMGHNAHIAWTGTTNQSDQTDIWAVDVSGGEVELGGESFVVEQDVQFIDVRLDDGSIESREITIQRVDGYGVILPEELLPLPSSLFGGNAILVNWPGFSATAEIFTFLDLDRATDLEDFEAAILEQRVGMHNWVAASADGIRYRAHGDIPDRGPLGARAAANQVLDATDPSTFWTGDMLPDSVMPRLDGSQDWIVTANNDPFGHTADNDPLNDAFYYGSYYAPAYRADRIASQLDAMISAGPVTVAQMTNLQMDARSLIAEALVPLFVDAASRIDTDKALAAFRERPDLVAAVERLDAWDRVMDRDSAEAAIFRAFSGYLGRRAFSGELSVLFDAVETAAPVTLANIVVLAFTQDNEALLDDDRDRFLVAALDDALAWTASRAMDLGVAELAWRDIHRGSFTPDLGAETLVPVDGDEATVNVSSCSFWDGSTPQDTCDANDGAIFRTVTSFDEDGTPVSWFTLPFGPDGDVDRWLDADYDTLPFRRADVEARTVETWAITP